MAKYLPYPDTHKDLWNFHPDDGDESFYVEDHISMSQLLARAHAKWPDGFADLDIKAEHIHTRCIYYDLHCPGDYDCFLLVTRIKE